MTGRRGRVILLSPWGVFWSVGGVGGTPIKVDICNALTEAGYEVHLVMPPGEPQEPPPGVRVHRIGELRVPRRNYPFRVIALAEYVARFVGRGLAVARSGERPVVVYGLGSYAVPAAALLGALLRRPAIGALFGTFLYPSLGHWPRLAASFEEVIAFRTPVSRLVLLNDGTRADRVARALGVPQERVEFLMHGVDTAACDAARARAGDARERLGIEPGTPLLVSSSRLTGWKRVDRVLRLMPHVLERHPDAVLAVSGDGPSEQELRALATELGIDASVRFTGPLPRARNLELTAAADVFCSFYDYSNVGVSLLEALTCGVPVVTLDTGATAEVVEDGVTGIVLGEYDEVGAAGVVAGLLGDPARRSRLADAAREHARRDLLDVSERKRIEAKLVDSVAGYGGSPGFGTYRPQ